MDRGNSWSLSLTTTGLIGKIGLHKFWIFNDRAYANQILDLNAMYLGNQILATGLKGHFEKMQGRLECTCRTWPRNGGRSTGTRGSSWIARSMDEAKAPVQPASGSPTLPNCPKDYSVRHLDLRVNVMLDVPPKQKSHPYCKACRKDCEYYKYQRMKQIYIYRNVRKIERDEFVMYRVWRV
jgi:hypothetical protein